MQKIMKQAAAGLGALIGLTAMIGSSFTLITLLTVQ